MNTTPTNIDMLIKMLYSTGELADSFRARATNLEQHLGTEHRENERLTAQVHHLREQIGELRREWEIVRNDPTFSQPGFADTIDAIFKALDEEDPKRMMAEQDDPDDR